jgi:hypothetical protein
VKVWLLTVISRGEGELEEEGKVALQPSPSLTGDGCATYLLRDLAMELEGGRVGGFGIRQREWRV